MIVVMLAIVVASVLCLGASGVTGMIGVRRVIAVSVSTSVPAGIVVIVVAMVVIVGVLIDAVCLVLALLLWSLCA